MTDFSPEAVDAAIAEARPSSLPPFLPTQSEHIDKISAALAKAQAEMPNAVYNRENPHFHSQYADLAAVRHATMCLHAHGIALHQSATFYNGQPIQVTQLTLGDQWLRDYRPLITALDKPQIMISLGTYMRRAGWTSITGVAVEGEDDDGNQATATKAITTTELDDLMSITQGQDTSVFLPWASEQLGYKIENLSMVRRKDATKVKSWLVSAMAKKEKKK